MGLANLLTKPIGCKMRFNEPFLAKARLRGQTRAMLAAIGGCMAVGIVGMLILQDAMKNPTLTPGLALGVGAFVGLMLVLCIVARDKNMGGTVSLKKRGIRRFGGGGGGFLDMLGGMISFREEEWPYASIEQCRIVHHDSSGVGFSVLEIHEWNGVTKIGVPRSADLKRLARSLQESGVSVSYVGHIPLSDASASYLWPSLRALIVLGVVLVVAYPLLRMAREEGSDDRRQPVADRDVPDGRFSPRPRPPRPEHRMPTREEILGLSPSSGGPPPPPPKPRRSSSRPSNKPSSSFSDRAAAFFGDMAKNAARNAEMNHTEIEETETRPAEIDPPDYRTWSDSTGKFQVEALLVKRNEETVTLRKRDGRTVVVPVARLAPADRAYLASSEPKDSPSVAPTLPKGVKRDTATVGGSEGWEFRHDDTRPVLGIRYRLGSWGGEKTMGKVEPIHERGTTGAHEMSVIAKDGYAVGSLNVDANQFVNGMQIVFMRLLPSGRLDPTDRYTSDWIGYRTGGQPRTLNTEGTTVVGIHGRHGAVLDAVGLILMGH